MRLPVLLVALALCSAAGAVAQINPAERSPYSPGGYYRYEDAGDLTIRVQAWGTVRYPGLHEVAQGVRVSRLLSLAGGPALTERRREDRRRLVVQLYRPSGTGNALVFEKQMRNGLAGLDEDPVLQEGDILTVDTVVKQGVTWREYVPIVTSAASILIGITSLIVTATR